MVLFIGFQTDLFPLSTSSKPIRWSSRENSLDSVRVFPAHGHLGMNLRVALRLPKSQGTLMAFHTKAVSGSLVGAIHSDIVDKLLDQAHKHKRTHTPHTHTHTQICTQNNGGSSIASIPMASNRQKGEHVWVCVCVCVCVCVYRCM
jgi:hypothetical protein